MGADVGRRLCHCHCEAAACRERSFLGCWVRAGIQREEAQESDSWRVMYPRAAWRGKIGDSKMKAKMHRGLDLRSKGEDMICGADGR